MTSRRLACIIAATVVALFSVASRAGPMTFAVVGDYGDDTRSSRYVADMITGTDWDPDFILTTGDNSYEPDTPDGWETAVGQYYGDYIQRRFDRAYPNQTGLSQRFFPTLGNHDVTWGDTTNAGFVDYFHTDPGSPRGRLPNGMIHDDVVYYDFQRGDVHLFVLDSVHAGDDPAVRTEQQEWLKKGLANSTATWNFVSMHHSPYSSGYHGDQEFMQWAFEDWGVDGVFSGHDHDYERSVRFGVPYFVNGLGGTSEYYFETDGFYSEVQYNRDYGAMRVSVEGDVATFQFLSIADGADGANGGTVIDTYTIDKNAPAPTYISLVPRGATWSFLDDGSDQGTAWKEIDFSPDGSWPQGPAQLGYGDGDEATVVSCGPNAPECKRDNYATTYFRTTFDIDASSLVRVDNLVLELIRDDGAAVYLNGVEVARDRLPPDAGYDDPALRPFPSEASESVPIPMLIDPSLLRAGTNVIAAEIHQESSTSDDLSFELQLTARLAWEYLAGDANRDGSFDQLDLVQVLQAGKYLSGQAATWGEGDWNGMPGDGVFDQGDIVQALVAGTYLAGPYGPSQSSGVPVHVPEPSALVLACAALFGSLIRRVRGARTGKPNKPHHAPARRHPPTCLLSAAAFVGALSLITVGRADILRWDTGEVIPGTEGVVPGPGLMLIDASLGHAEFSQEDLTAVYLQRSDLSHARFRGTNLTDARLWNATLSGADFSGAIIQMTNLSGTTERGFTAEQLYSTASYQQGDLQEIVLGNNELIGWDLAGKNLREASFSGATLSDTDLRGSDLYFGKFGYATLSRVDLSNANLPIASFEDSRLSECDLRNASAAGSFWHATISDTDFRGADLADANFERSELTRIDFRGADLTNASFDYALLSGVDFGGMDLTNASFNNATLLETGFTDAVIRDASFWDTTDQGFTAQKLYSTASYERGDLHGIDLGRNDLTGWNLAGMDLNQASFDQSVADRIDMHGATAVSARFDRASLVQAILAGADLTHASLERAVLSGADFSDARIAGANLAGVTGRGFTAGQLYSTASYQTGDLSSMQLFSNDLTGWNFDGKNLSETQFTGSDLSGASFVGANLTNCWLDSTTLVGTNFSGADLNDAKLGGTTLSAARLSDANLFDVSFSNTTLSDVDFSRSDLTNVKFYSSTLRDVDFTDANLTGASFEQSWLSRLTLVGAVLKDATFKNTALDGVDFSGADVRYADLARTTPLGFTADQLYATASYQQGDLTGVNLSENDMSGWNLSGQKLSHGSYVRTDLTNTALNGTDLSQASLNQATLAGTDLSGANLTETSFVRATLSDANFSGANLTGASFVEATLSGVSFRDANLSGADLRAVLLADVDFRGADVSGTRLSYATERGFSAEQLYSTASYQQRELRGVYFGQNDFSGWNLAGMDLTGSWFDASDLTRADLSQARLVEASFERAELSNANLHGAQTNQANFLRATLSAANLKASDLSDAVFKRATLTGADLSEANLTRATFEDATLDHANLSLADLTDVSFQNATLTGASLRGATLRGTIFELATLDEVDFVDADIRGVNLNGATVHGFRAIQLYDTASYKSGQLNDVQLQSNNLSGLDFAGMNLAGSSFRYGTLTGTNMSDSNLAFARLDHATLTDADLRRARLVAADFHRAQLSGASLRGADLSGADFGYAMLANADFSAAIVEGVELGATTDNGFTAEQLYSTASYRQGDLSGIRLRLNDLSGWSFAGQILTNAWFVDSTLAGADFRGADLTGALLHGARLVDANLSGATLAGASLTRADLRGALGFDADTNELADAANMIGPDGTVMGLRLEGALSEFAVYDHRLRVTVSESLWMDRHSKLELVVSDAEWGSTIQIADGAVAQLGGALALTWSPDADVENMVGTTFDLFDWNGTLDPDSAFDSILLPDNTIWDLSDLYRTGDVVLTELVPQLQAGDADQDSDFDQFDLVKVQQAGKYRTLRPATWGEGDWNGAPGGSAGSPPPGDGVFDQLDIVAALQGGVYLTGPYAAITIGGQRDDGQTSIVYHADTGELAVDAPAGSALTSISIESASGIFTGSPAESLGGDFDIDTDSSIFKATFGSRFRSLSFGKVAPAGLSEEFVLNDLAVVGSLAGGGGLGDVDLVYVPEPTSAVLLALGLVVGLAVVRSRVGSPGAGRDDRLPYAVFRSVCGTLASTVERGSLTNHSGVREITSPDRFLTLSTGAGGGSAKAVDLCLSCAATVETEMTVTRQSP